MLILKKKFEANSRNYAYLSKFKSPLYPNECRLYEMDDMDEEQISFLESLYDTVMSGLKAGKFDKIVPMYDFDDMEQPVSLVDDRGAKIVVAYFEIADEDGEVFISLAPAYINLSLDEPDLGLGEVCFYYLEEEDLAKLGKTDETKLVQTVYRKILNEWEEFVDGMWG